MKTLNSRFVTFGILILFSIMSCTRNTDPQGTDPASFANYTINNQSSILLTYASNNENITIPASQTVSIGGASQFGTTVPIPPSGYFNGLVLLKNQDGNFVPALSINPIVDEQWSEESISNNSSTFTLTITDELLN